MLRESCSYLQNLSRLSVLGEVMMMSMKALRISLLSDSLKGSLYQRSAHHSALGAFLFSTASTQDTPKGSCFLGADATPSRAGCRVPNDLQVPSYLHGLRPSNASEFSSLQPVGLAESRLFRCRDDSAHERSPAHNNLVRTFEGPNSRPVSYRAYARSRGSTRGSGEVDARLHQTTWDASLGYCSFRHPDGMDKALRTSSPRGYGHMDSLRADLQSMNATQFAVRSEGNHAEDLQYGQISW